MVPVPTPTLELKPPVPRYRSLDAWRGIACLMIVVFHQTTLLTHWGQDQAIMGSVGAATKVFLAIVQEIADLHHASVQVRSAMGSGGTRFSVVFGPV